MNDVVVYFVISLGVLTAVLYPTLLGYVRGAFPVTQAPGLPPWVKKYAALLAFSLLTASILLAGYRAAKPDASIPLYAAFIIGFGWEASVEKLLNPPKRSA